ncbi:hypothetical protein HK104_002416, partial [Borealophlyctis nickersoniae]
MADTPWHQWQPVHRQSFASISIESALSHMYKGQQSHSFSTGPKRGVSQRLHSRESEGAVGSEDAQWDEGDVREPDGLEKSLSPNGEDKKREEDHQKAGNTVVQGGRKIGADALSGMDSGDNADVSGTAAKVTPSHSHTGRPNSSQKISQNPTAKLRATSTPAHVDAGIDEPKRQSTPAAILTSASAIPAEVVPPISSTLAKSRFTANKRSTESLLSSSSSTESPHSSSTSLGTFSYSSSLTSLAAEKRGKRKKQKKPKDSNRAVSLRPTGSPTAKEEHIRPQLVTQRPAPKQPKKKKDVTRSMIDTSVAGQSAAPKRVVRRSSTLPPPTEVVSQRRRGDGGRVSVDGEEVSDESEEWLAKGKQRSSLPELMDNPYDLNRHSPDDGGRGSRGMIVEEDGRMAETTQETEEKVPSPRLLGVGQTASVETTLASSTVPVEMSPPDKNLLPSLPRLTGQDHPKPELAAQTVSTSKEPATLAPAELAPARPRPVTAQRSVTWADEAKRNVRPSMPPTSEAQHQPESRSSTPRRKNLPPITPQLAWEPKPVTSPAMNTHEDRPQSRDPQPASSVVPGNLSETSSNSTPRSSLPSIMSTPSTPDAATTLILPLSIDRESSTGNINVRFPTVTFNSQRLTDGLDPWVDIDANSGSSPDGRAPSSSAKDGHGRRGYKSRNSGTSRSSKRHKPSRVRGTSNIAVLDMNVATKDRIGRGGSQIHSAVKTFKPTTQHTHREPATVVWPHAFIDSRALMDLDSPTPTPAIPQPAPTSPSRRHTPPRPQRQPTSHTRPTSSSSTHHILRQCCSAPRRRPTSFSFRTRPLSAPKKSVLKIRVSSAFRRIPSARRWRPRTGTVTITPSSSSHPPASAPPVRHMFAGSAPRRVSTSRPGDHSGSHAPPEVHVSVVKIEKGADGGEGVNNLRFLVTARNVEK